MKTIELKPDSVYLNMSLDELIIFRNSLIEVLSNVKQNEFKTRTGFNIEEIEVILNSIIKAIKKIE